MLKSLADRDTKFLSFKSLKAVVSVLYSNYGLVKMMPSFLHQLSRKEISKTSTVF